MTRTCDELGVCNGRHCKDVSACYDYDLIACNSGPCDGAANAPCPYAAIDRKVARTLEPPQPTYPFAPGIIEGPPVPGGPFDAPLGITLKDAAIILVMAALCAGAAGLLVGWLSGWPK